MSKMYLLSIFTNSLKFKNLQTWRNHMNYLTTYDNSQRKRQQCYHVFLRIERKSKSKNVWEICNSTYLQTRHLVRLASAAALTPLSSILLTTSITKEGGIPRKMKVGTYCMWRTLSEESHKSKRFILLGKMCALFANAYLSVATTSIVITVGLLCRQKNRADVERTERIDF